MGSFRKVFSFDGLFRPPLTFPATIVVGIVIHSSSGSRSSSASSSRKIGIRIGRKTGTQMKAGGQIEREAEGGGDGFQSRRMSISMALSESAAVASVKALMLAEVPERRLRRHWVVFIKHRQAQEWQIVYPKVQAPRIRANRMARERPWVPQ